MKKLFGPYRELLSGSRYKSRSDFWFFVGYFFAVLTVVLLIGIASSTAEIPFLRVLLAIWGLPTFVAVLRMMPGRLRDAGYSPQYAFVALVPAAGAVLLLLALTKKSVEIEETGTGERPRTGSAARLGDSF